MAEKAEKSNFERMCDHAREMFTGYDREEMFGKYGIPGDERYLYLTFFGSEFRVERDTGIVEEKEEENWIPAGPEVAMTFYDVLCYGKKDAAAAGEFVNINSLVHQISATGNPGDGFNARYDSLFEKKNSELAAVLTKMGGFESGKGDVAYQLPMFPFMDCRIAYWNSDDEFPASLNFFVDKNILSFMHFETVWYVVSFFLRRLKDLVL